MTDKCTCRKSSVVLKLRMFECSDKFQHVFWGWGKGVVGFVTLKPLLMNYLRRGEKQMNVDRFTDMNSYFNFRLREGDISIKTNTVIF